MAIAVWSVTLMTTGVMLSNGGVPTTGSGRSPTMLVADSLILISLLWNSSESQVRPFSFVNSRTFQDVASCILDVGKFFVCDSDRVGTDPQNCDLQSGPPIT